MVTRFVATAALLAASIPGSAFAQQPYGGPSDNIVVTGQQYDNKVVCRYEQKTGSRFQTRTCHTNKEWDEMREQQMRAAKEMIGPLIGACKGGGFSCPSGVDSMSPMGR
jgi:hypothetical protein